MLQPTRFSFNQQVNSLGTFFFHLCRIITLAAYTVYRDSDLFGLWENTWMYHRESVEMSVIITNDSVCSWNGLGVNRQQYLSIIQVFVCLSCRCQSPVLEWLRHAGLWNMWTVWGTKTHKDKINYLKLHLLAPVYATCLKVWNLTCKISLWTEKANYSQIYSEHYTVKRMAGE